MYPYSSTGIYLLKFRHPNRLLSLHLHEPHFSEIEAKVRVLKGGIVIDQLLIVNHSRLDSCSRDGCKSKDCCNDLHDGGSRALEETQTGLASRASRYVLLT